MSIIMPDELMRRLNRAALLGVSERLESLRRRENHCRIDEGLRAERQRETWRMFVAVNKA